MGTSSSYGGPKGKNPLLPNDFDENGNSIEIPSESSNNDNNVQHINNADTKLWKTVKSLTSKLINGSVKNKRDVFSKYVKAHGGAKKAAFSAKAGKATAKKLGGFLSVISKQGIHDTFKKYGIDYENKSVEEVLSEIVNKIAPTGKTKEEVVARNAIIDVIESIYEYYEDVEKNNGNLSLLENLNEEQFNDIMRKYISAYIFQRFLNDLESRFEEYAKNTGTALEIENDIKEYISGVVDNKLQGTNFTNFDYSDENIIQTIGNIYEECYKVIEDIL